MENASKALLIAGAILVCILLIGIGMLVYQSAQGTISEAVSQMNSQEKEAFNSQFSQYAGNNRSGSQVKALLQKVSSNNVTNEGVDGKVVSVSFDSTGAGNNVKAPEQKTGATDTKIISGYITNVNTAKNYQVFCTDTDSDGLIDTIQIKGWGGTSTTSGSNQ